MTEVPAPQHRPMWRIVLGMSVVIALLVLAMVLVAVNESATQRNASQQARANESLQLELRCRAEPQLRYDQADATLSALIAETLATLGQLTPAEIDERRMAIIAAVAEVRVALDDREASLIVCADAADG